jgi:putative transferase (TIGR04331 family)
MNSVARYLITTSDETTWKFDRPVIFLGEWCRVYDRKHIWQHMDAIVAEPYGLSSEQKDSDDAEAREYEENLLIVLRDALNKYHGTQHGSRFWRIVLGHWLRRYVDVIFNRVRTLEQCLQNYRLSGTALINVDCYHLAAMDSEEAIRTFNDDRWNNALYIRILNLLNKSNLPIEYVSGNETKYRVAEITVSHVSLKRKLLRWGYRQIGKLAGLLAKENDAFIINSYLPKKDLVKLQLAMLQVPQFWVSPKLKFTKKPDEGLRQKLSADVATKPDNTLYDILQTLIFELIPTCYLENFPELQENIGKVRWPKCPKFIFTSNSFDTDEVFKLWAASKIESGYPYIAGQHGNNYGTHRYFGKLTPEETSSTKFLTWGWSDGLPQHTPAFMLKLSVHEMATCNTSGDLLLIELGEPYRITTWDCTFEFGEYFAEQKAFVENLKSASRKQLKIRLPAPNMNSRWRYESRWREFDQEINLDNGDTKLSELIKQSRLVVHSYDSTGILETLSQNIPTLIFWQSNLDHLRDCAKPYYQKLIDAGIIHLTPQSAAAKVNEVWDDVAGWWSQSRIQDARSQFCNRYAKISNSPVMDLKALLTE